MSAAAGTLPDEGVGPSCQLYAWCVRETTTYARDGSSAWFHHGVVTRLQAGDESLTLERVATEDSGEEFVELQLSSATRQGGQLSAWLSLHEVRSLADLLRLE